MKSLKLFLIIIFFLTCGIQESKGNVNSIDFNSCADYLIVTTLKVNDEEVEFLIDTGANITVLDKELDGFSVADFGEAIDSISGSVRVNSVLIDEIKLGTIFIENVSGLSVDLSSIKKLCPSVQGVLGNDVLSQFNYMIDYETKKLLVSEGDITFEKSETIAFTSKGDRMHVRLDIEDQNKEFVFDSAASNVFEFTDRKIKDINALLTDHKGVNQASVVNASLSLGKLKFRAMCGIVFSANRDEDGLLASRVFRAFRVDNRHRKISVKM